MCVCVCVCVHTCVRVLKSGVRACACVDGLRCLRFYALGSCVYVCVCVVCARVRASVHMRAGRYLDGCTTTNTRFKYTSSKRGTLVRQNWHQRNNYRLLRGASHKLSSKTGVDNLR